MQFGDRQKFAIECELTDTSVPYFFGRFRIWIAGRPHGDFSGEIISTYVIYLSRIVREYERSEVDGSGRLPYMEELTWRVMSGPSGDRIVAGVGDEDPATVYLRPGEFRDIADQFFDWVLSDPKFSAVQRSEVFRDRERPHSVG